MAKISREQKDELEAKIKSLLNAGAYDHQIVSALDINIRTLYRYKKKFIKEVVRYHKPYPQEIEDQYALLKQSLEETYQVNKQIMMNTKYSPQARTAASEMASIARGQIALLAKEGYVRPQLEIRENVGKVLPIDGKEITTTPQ